MTQRDALLAQTFVDVADSLVADFDVVELLTTLSSRCVELFDVAESAILLLDAENGLRVAASSSPFVAHYELLEIRRGEGPCHESSRTGHPAISADVAAEDRWPKFSGQALSAGYKSAYALPLRLRDQSIGALNLLGHESDVLRAEDIVAAQALADVATIALLHDRAARESKLLTDQLEYALESRATIEQAKGVIACTAGVDVDKAFTVLRRYARDHNLRLTDMSTALVNGQLDPETIAAYKNPAFRNR